jgi:hypothetical protein
MKLVGNTTHFPDPQPKLHFTFRLHFSQTFTQVKAYITNSSINLADVSGLITSLETVFGDQYRVATVECKLEVLKQTNSNFSTYYVEFSQFATDLQWNNSAQRTVLIQSLNNKIEKALTLSHNVPQQFQDFVAFLQRLNNWI